MIFELFLIIALVVLCALYHVHRLKSLPPVVEGFWPLIGHTLLIVRATNYFQILDEHINKLLMQKKYTVTLSLGPWFLYGVLDPDDAHVVANSCLTKDAFSYHHLKPIFGEGLLTVEGAKWKPRRKLMSPAFNQVVLDGFIPEFNRQARLLLDSISVEEDSGPFNHTKYISDTLMKVISATTIGMPIDQEDKKTREDFIKTEVEFMCSVMYRVTRFWLYNDFMYSLTGRNKPVKMLTSKMKALSHTIFDRKKAQYEKAKTQTDVPKNRFKCFMELLLELPEDSGLSEQEISDEMNTFFVAGSDTMTSAMTTILTCLGSYLTVQQKVHQELQEVFQDSDRDVERDDLSKLKYLEAVIKETLRLYPPVPLYGRTLDKDVQLKNYTLPAGSHCYLVGYAILRHPTWGPDAAQYRPERWIDGSLPPNLKSFAAFGIGKRNCIGSHFAIMCMKTVLAGILRRYSVRSDITQMVQDIGIITRPVSGHHITIERRL